MNVNENQQKARYSRISPGVPAAGPAPDRYFAAA
jgi:hypothetical protein